MRQSLLMQLHQEALAGIHIFAGTFRNGPAEIHGSNHEPPPAFMVGEEVAHMLGIMPGFSWASGLPFKDKWETLPH